MFVFVVILFIQNEKGDLVSARDMGLERKKESTVSPLDVGLPIYFALFKLIFDITTYSNSLFVIEYRPSHWSCWPYCPSPKTQGCRCHY